MLEHILPGRSRLRPLDWLLIAIVTIAVFIPNLHGRISPLDDETLLTTTQQFKTPTWAGYFRFWTDPPFRMFMPLPLTVWQGIAAFSYWPQYEPWPWLMTPIGFKAASIIVHALAAMAATWSVSLMTRTRLPAICGGLLFALHPVQVEAVCWTTGLKDELCGLFAFLTIAFYLRFLTAPDGRPWMNRSWCCALFAMTLAMLSKPTAVVLPITLAALDYAFRRGTLVRRLPALWPFILLCTGGAMLARSLQSHPVVPEVPVWARPLIAADSYAFYLCKLVWPNVSVDYARHPGYVWHTGQIAWTWLLPAAAASAVLLMRSWLLVLAAALFVIPILPVSGLQPFDMQQYSTVADHYLYQSLLGVGLILALLVERFDRVRVPALALLLVCAGLSWSQARLWRLPADLFEKTLRQNPRSWMASASLTALAMQVNDLSTAERMIRRTLTIRPDYGNAFQTLAIVRIRQGRYREAITPAFAAFEYNGDASRKLLVTKLLRIAAMDQDKRLAYAAAVEWLKFEPGNTLARKLKSDFAGVLSSRPTTERSR